MTQFQERIHYQGDLKPFLESICSDFDFGHYVNYEIITQGYEDFNLEVETNKQKVFVKVFAKDREKEEVERIVSVLEAIIHTQIRTPKLYKSNHGYLDSLVMGNTTDKVIATQWIDGKNLYESNSQLSDIDKREIVCQAALINQLNFRPAYVYDQWAIPNFITEYRKKDECLDNEAKKLIFPLVEPFQKLNIDSLPYSFVHGDLIKTNILKDKEGALYIVDFSVANYYPRIQELAVLLTSPLFDEADINAYKITYGLVLAEYQKHIQLTETEIDLLPLFVRVGHAMHLLNATWEKVHNGNVSEENSYWLNLGKIGLQFTQRMWNVE